MDMNKKLITIIAGTVAVIIIVIAIATGASGNTSVKVSDYVELTLSGYSGYTSIPSHITEFLDEESLENEIISKDGTIENWQITNGGYLYDKEVMFVTVEETESKYLSNGDTIKYTITINKDRFEALTGLKLKGKKEIKGKYKISGLEEITEINLFNYLYVSTNWGPESDFEFVDITMDNLPETIGNIKISYDKLYKDIYFYNPQTNKRTSIKIVSNPSSVNTPEEKVKLYVLHYSEYIEKELAEIGIKLSKTEHEYEQTIVK